MALRLQKKTVSPSENQQKIIFDEGFDGLEEVTVNAIQTEEKSVSSNGTYTPTAGKYFKKFIVSIPEKIFGTKTISQNGTYKATDDGLDGFSQVIVDVPDREYKTQSKSVSPTESTQNVTADSDFDALSSVSVGAISSTYVGSGVTRRSGTDLSVNGKTVTVPSGYYSSQQSKAVSDGSVTLATPTVNSNGLVTASATVNAGYIDSSPSDKTLQLTTQAAKAVTPSKSSQTVVPSGRYTTGAVTVNPIPDEYIIPSGNIELTDNGTTDVTKLSSVTVNIPFQRYYTGTSNPASSLGNDGDIYLKG